MKNNEKTESPKIEKSYYSTDQKKHIIIKSPDINKMQEVVIDDRTKIYIAVGADPEEARSRYLKRLEPKLKEPFVSRKPVAN